MAALADPVGLTDSSTIPGMSSRNEMPGNGAQASMTVAPPQYSSPPPEHKQFTSSIQQPLAGSHPMPAFSPPPPCYKRSPSPSPTTLSQPTLNELPSYTPRASDPDPRSGSRPKPVPKPNSWSSWNLRNWSLLSRNRERTTKESGQRGVRDPMAGQRGIELDAYERYELDQQRIRDDEYREKDWCCLCFWAGPPLPSQAHYVF